MPDEIWGVFSVEDFLRPRAFVAEVLLYDRLVIPYPTSDERESWASRGLDLAVLERQMSLLDAAKLLRSAPWSEAKTDLFRQRLESADALTDDVALREHLLSAGYDDWVTGASPAWCSPTISRRFRNGSGIWRSRPGPTWSPSLRIRRTALSRQMFRSYPCWTSTGWGRQLRRGRPSSQGCSRGSSSCRRPAT